MGKRQGERQQDLWLPAAQMPQTPGHPFYQKLNHLLARHGFDPFVKGLDSERGSAWRCADSPTLSSFLGYGPTQSTPDHSILSIIRERIDVETHEAVFTWVLKVLASEGQLKGKTMAWTPRRWTPTRPCAASPTLGRRFCAGAGRLPSRRVEGAAAVHGGCLVLCSHRHCDLAVR